ncbi:MAG: ferritin [Eubacteriaceae bacterium]|nr:ferritin [Eubacteriaceae bacterium]
MLSKKLIDEINEQIKYEFFSAHLYLSMASFAANNDLPGFENWFIVQADEERFHAMKFYHFLNSRAEKAVLKGFDDPKENYDDIIDAFAYSLEHEKFVSSRIYHLMDIAQEEKEYATISLLNWFVDEQVEEEDNFGRILSQLKKISGNEDGLFRLDRELATRVFVPPVTP